MVYFVRNDELIVGRLTGRIISGKYEIKAIDGTYQYTKNYKEYEVLKDKVLRSIENDN